MLKHTLRTILEAAASLLDRSSKALFLLYVLCVLLIAWNSVRKPIPTIDLLSHLGNIKAAETTDPVSIHAYVYGHPLNDHLRGKNDSRSAPIIRLRAKDPYYSTTYLPFFSVKPLYVLLLRAFISAGLNGFEAARAVSILGLIGIAFAVWLITKSPLSIAVIALPDIRILGQLTEPDSISTATALLGLWFLFQENNEWGFVPLLLAVWIRPENALLVLFVVALRVVQNRLAVRDAIALCALGIGSALLISQFGYSWQILYGRTFGGHSLLFTGAEHYSISRLPTEIVRGFASLPPVLLAYSVAGLVAWRFSTYSIRSTLLVVSAFILARFLIFPSYETRYFGLFFVSVGCAVVCALTSVFNHPAGRITASSVTGERLDVTSISR